MDVINIIQEIRNLKEEEINNWIDNRIARIKKEEINPIENLQINNKNIETSFIQCEKIIDNKNFEMRPFKIDNNNYLKQLIEEIRKAEEELSTNNNYIVHMVQCTIINYFGLHGVEESRNDLFKSNKKEVLSISDFEKNLTAMSVERSAIAQNILTFLGYNAILDYGNLINRNNSEEEPHSYNCIINNGMALLIDFTNPSYLDGQYYIPACFAIGQEQLQGFLNGETQIEFEHKDYYTKDGEIKEYETSMIYASNPVLEETETEKNNVQESANIITDKKQEKQTLEETRMTLIPKVKWYQKIVDFFKKLFKRNKDKEQKLLSN